MRRWYTDESDRAGWRSRPGAARQRLLSELIASQLTHNQSVGKSYQRLFAVTSGRTRAESNPDLTRAVASGRYPSVFRENFLFSFPQALASAAAATLPIERFVRVTNCRLSDSSTRRRICYLRCGAGRRGGGFFGKNQWRQQTRRCTRIWPQRDRRGTRRALEAEVQGEVDRARRSAGGGVPPAPSLATPPTSSRATLSPLQLSSADNYDEDESASGGGNQLGPWETAQPAEPKPPSCSSIDQGSESL